MSSDFQHVIITGHGRSGTNLVLDLLDCSSTTICRNEPNEVTRSSFRNLKDGFFPPDNPEEDAPEFGRVLAASKERMSPRDRFPVDYKRHYRNRFGLKRFLDIRGRRPGRRALALLRGADYSEEWAIPHVFYDIDAFKAALPVYKILLWSGRIAASHDVLTGQKVIHVVREPRSFIMSWYARYVVAVHGGEQKVFYDNMRSAQDISRHYGHDPIDMRAFSVPGLIESELWRWRYVNEHLYDALKGSPRYLPVTYATVMSSKPEAARNMAAFCGLDYDPAFEKRVRGNENTLFAKRQDPILDRNMVDDLIATVMEGSTLTSLLETTG